MPADTRDTSGGFLRNGPRREREGDMRRVIQWGTGSVGRHAIAAVHGHPDLRVVGGFVYSEAKAGRDVGEICGIGDLGVRATRDRDEILALDADCVLYMAQGEMNPAGALDDICRLLASGKNVISTAVTSFIYPRSAGKEVVDQLEAACAAGGTSFHGTGIEPGWAAEVLPLTMSPLFRRIDSLLVQEILDYSTYDSAAMLFDIMGFGRAPDAPVPMADPAIAGSVFHAPIMMVADGLGATIDELRHDRSVTVAGAGFDITAGRVEAGTVSAQRFSCTAVINGRAALTVEHITRVGDGQAPDWPTGRGWRVTVEGEPSMTLESRIAVHDEDENDQGCLGTAMHAVHTIAPLCQAEPGIRTFLDLPLLTGRHVFAGGGAPR
ncbi:putative Amine dehydrogenase [Frankia sp. AiPs1]|uniref:NAD(P)H-dependent amine dehydrogenase family protein n=1 Tax=Frankia sp. AiPa1 TaxID=573492 RepID=UPI00202B99CD|nr:dihydrodipicolinate reductase [Frankia sp. AiPa1]MCL9760457.1 dihydrodipicolinate reductase [Frankia sp. AiPa1]